MVLVYCIDVERLEKIVDKWGHVLRLKREDIYKADAWFDKYGVWTVFFCRIVPLIRSLISIPAGMSNMKFWLFLHIHNSRDIDLEYYPRECGGSSWLILGKYCELYGCLFKYRLCYFGIAVYYCCCYFCEKKIKKVVKEKNNGLCFH